MKTRLITLVFSAFFCITLCLYSNFFVGRVMEKVTQDAEQMEKLLAEGEVQSAKQVSDRLTAYIKKNERFLESLIPHEDLHDLSVQIADVSLSIRISDLDDCKKAIALLLENTEHLTKHEAFSFGNIF